MGKSEEEINLPPIPKGFTLKLPYNRRNLMGDADATFGLDPEQKPEKPSKFRAVPMTRTRFRRPLVMLGMVMLAPTMT